MRAISARVGNLNALACHQSNGSCVAPIHGSDSYSVTSVGDDGAEEAAPSSGAKTAGSPNENVFVVSERFTGECKGAT